MIDNLACHMAHQHLQMSVITHWNVLLKLLLENITYTAGTISDVMFFKLSCNVNTHKKLRMFILKINEFVSPP